MSVMSSCRTFAKAKARALGAPWHVNALTCWLHVQSGTHRWGGAGVVCPVKGQVPVRH
jgi:hypothetical protein